MIIMMIMVIVMTMIIMMIWHWALVLKLDNNNNNNDNIPPTSHSLVWTRGKIKTSVTEEKTLIDFGQ